VPGTTTGLRVLVVDDVEEVRILIQRALGARGYDVDVAATLAEARRLDPGGYDAVLVDAHLGSERGMDLVEALRSEDPQAVGRCLVMTGGTTDTLPDGVARLAKPFQLGELIDAVRVLHEPDTGPQPGIAPGSARQPGIAPGPGRRLGIAPGSARQPGIAPGPGRRLGTAPGSGADPLASVPPGGSRPAAGEAQTWQLLRVTRRLRARERHELVDFLHDGPIQELTAVTLELQMMCRSVPPAPRLDAVLHRLSSAAGSLRWLVDGPWPFLEPEVRLAAALQQRTAWLLAAPVTVDADEHAAGLGPAEVSAVADVVELMLLGMVTANPPAQARVAVGTDEHMIQIDLTLMSAAGDDQAIGDPATAQAALDELASALGASMQARLSGRRWRARIGLPRQPAPVH
jgi:CheY-like chemotaxis protein